MYSDDDSIVSSHSSGSAQLPRNGRHKGPTNGQRGAGVAESGSASASSYGSDGDDSHRHGSGSSDDDSDDSGYRGAFAPTAVPVECLERCAILVDAALFDPRSGSEDANERVVEFSLKVIEYPFCRPSASPTETFIFSPAVSATKMTKIQRATTAQHWGQLIATQHGIPAEISGTSTGFDELTKTARTYQACLQSYCHGLKSVSAGSFAGGSMDAHVTVALRDSELGDTMSNIIWDSVSAAVDVSRAEGQGAKVAFLTPAKRYDEVCQCLLWLQREARISFPPHQVYTLESALGKPWEQLVLTEKDNYCCGYHDYLMTNNYGNRRHCCQGTVTATWKVMEAAVRNLYAS